MHSEDLIHSPAIIFGNQFGNDINMVNTFQILKMKWQESHDVVTQHSE
jgi:hypothetical protein